MSTRKPGLGRGLDALLSRPQAAPEPDRLRDLPLENIRRGEYQPRIHIDAAALEELAASIRSQGVVQPVAVRKVASGYELIAGERRWRAAQMAGLRTIPAVVHDLDDAATAAMALIENIQREDLNALEEALAIHRLIEEFDLTHQAAADAIGRSRAAVSNLLRLLALSPDVQEHMHQGRLEMGHARALLALDAPRQIEAAREIIARKLTVREAERLVQRLLQPAEAPPPSRQVDPEIRRLQDRLADRLGAPVEIRASDKGRGTVVIRYHSLDELDGLLARFDR